jgi:hypothetical protein
MKEGKAVAQVVQQPFVFDIGGVRAQAPLGKP